MTEYAIRIDDEYLYDSYDDSQYYNTRLSEKSKLSWLWERLPAAKLNDRGWKPLPQEFFSGNSDFLDKRIVIFISEYVGHGQTVNSQKISDQSYLTIRCADGK